MRIRRWLRVLRKVDAVTDPVHSDSGRRGAEWPAVDDAELESCQAREDVHDLVKRLREVLDSPILK